jgi:serine protease
MTTLRIAQRALARLSAGLALALAMCGAQAQTAKPAYGLIVKLKDAPAHESVQSAAGAARAQAERGRWQRVLADASVAGATRGLGEARLRATGRAAQLMHFDRPLSGDEASTLAERLLSRPEVEWVVPNEREHRLQVVPNDPCFAPNKPACPFVTTDGQWWLTPVSGSYGLPLAARLRGVPGIQDAWNTETGKPSAVVAVLDTGITPHTELSASTLLPGYDMVSELDYANDGDGRDANPADPGDWVTSAEKAGNPLFKDCEVANSSWHGTIIAGLIAAATDNNAGVAGISWGGRVLPVRVAGKCGGTVSDIIDGMYWAAGLPVANAPLNANPARVVNISFGSSAACNVAYQTAIDDLRTAGVVVVAAAGNEHTGVIRPASCNGVIAVAALHRDGFKTSYSNFGPQVVVSTVGGDDSSGTWSDLSDGGLLTLDNQGATSPGAGWYAHVFGTSFAAPVVAGTVSLMLSVNPSLTVDQIVTGLRSSARPHVTSNVIGQCSASNPGRCICTTSTCGAGILDAPEALRYAQNPGGYVPLTLSGANIDGPEIIADAARGPDVPQSSSSTTATSSGGGGGGALDAAWLAILLFTLAALLATRRSTRGR